MTGQWLRKLDDRCITETIRKLKVYAFYAGQSPLAREVLGDLSTMLSHLGLNIKVEGEIEKLLVTREGQKTAVYSMAAKMEMLAVKR